VGINNNRKQKNMVPQMTDKHRDTYEIIRQTRREQLIDQCLKMGMPVVGDEDEETLEMYIDTAIDDDFDDLRLDEDFNDDRITNETSDGKKTSILGKLVSLFM
jgi:hypothetical protein